MRERENGLVVERETCFFVKWFRYAPVQNELPLFFVRIEEKEQKKKIKKSQSKLPATHYFIYFL